MYCPFKFKIQDDLDMRCYQECDERECALFLADRESPDCSIKRLALALDDIMDECTDSSDSLHYIRKAVEEM